MFGIKSEEHEFYQLIATAQFEGAASKINELIAIAQNFNNNPNLESLIDIKKLNNDLEAARNGDLEKKEVIENLRSLEGVMENMRREQSESMAMLEGRIQEFHQQNEALVKEIAELRSRPPKVNVQPAQINVEHESSDSGLNIGGFFKNAIALVQGVSSLFSLFKNFGK